MNRAPKTANATFCATLCDQFWSDGLRTAFIAPGSRSTPLALALMEHPEIAVEVFHDERSASFAALGSGLAHGVPGLVLCSSGTAGAHFYAAVIEADAAAVPMIVCTADRPPELWNRGAPQTIDQTELYGATVRSFVEPGPPDELDPATWRNLARALWSAATGGPGQTPGPVHANLSFRDPLTGTADALPPSIEALPSQPAPAVDVATANVVSGLLRSPRGVIVAGRSETHPDVVLGIAEKLRWPVIADHRSGCRTGASDLVVKHFDALLRDPTFASDHRPDVVLRIGEIVSSKSTSQWLSACAREGTTVVSSRPHGRYIDPEDIASTQFIEHGFLEALHIAERSDDLGWARKWIAADRVAADAIDTVLASTPPNNEIAIARAALAAVPSGGVLVVASSMPVRDVEWFGQNRSDVRVVANRGANGIDGTIATAIGCALTGYPTLCLVGDVAFLHDSSSLIGLQRREIDLTVVVTDNDGGGIFSFLPQHDLLDIEEYETLFGTPHGTDLRRLVAAHGLRSRPYTGTVPPPAGIEIVIASTNRDENRRLHDQVNQAVADRLPGTPQR